MMLGFVNKSADVADFVAKAMRPMPQSPEPVVFRFIPGQYVEVTLFRLGYLGRVQRCLWSGHEPYYDVEYCRDGNIERREFEEDELREAAGKA